MQIAIDITPLKTEHKVRGTGSYTQNLISALEKYKSEHLYSFFTRSQKLPNNVDLVHYPYFDPFFITLPVIKRFTSVVTVHDIIPIQFPEHFPRGIRGEIKWQIQKSLIKIMDRIITDSKASRESIVQNINVPEDRVSVIPLAPAEHFAPVKNATVLQKAQKKYSLPRLFVLYVGDINWNKNIFGLLRAFRDVIFHKTAPFGSVNKANTDMRLDLRLVLVGKAFKNNKLNEAQEIDKVIHKLGIASNVIKLGYVEDKDLPSIYSLARVYIQPSFAEGFGLPVLEAMACGCVVVSSCNSSLQEIAGPAIRIQPESPESIAQGMLQGLLLPEDKLKAYKQKAANWCRKFSWEMVARATVKTYEQALEES